MVRREKQQRPLLGVNDQDEEEVKGKRDCRYSQHPLG
jgi:hypothetical protein